MNHSMKIVKSLFLLFLIGGTSLQAQINAYAINFILTDSGQKSFDLNSDGTDDFIFDILPLGQGNLAARVNGINSSEILDNSTFGYPDTLNTWDPVTGYFHTGIGVLGTFHNGALFKGAGKKFLGMKIHTSAGLLAGWFELRVSANNDTLEILSCGYLTSPNGTIAAGQLYMTGLSGLTESMENVVFYPNPTVGTLYISGLSNGEFAYTIYSVNGTCVQRGVAKTALDLAHIPEGIYFIGIQAGDQKITRKISVKK